MQSPPAVVAPSRPDVEAVPVVEKSLTLRVVLLSLGLAAMFGFVIPIVDYKFTNTFMGAAHLPTAAIAVLLFVMLLLNPLLKLFSKKWAFTRNETLTVYISCLFSTLVPGRGGENFWIPNVLASFYYATRENKWAAFLQPYLKPWFTPALSPNAAANDVVGSWYTGAGRGGGVPWEAWLAPITAWALVVLALYIMLACLGVILRAQWAEREALSFPLLRLPLEMTENMNGESKSTPFLRNGLMWMGFVLAVFIQLLNGLNLYFPDVPRVPLDIPTTGLFSEAPWNQMGGLTLRLWPVAVGISYLLSSEVSFSLWFFFLLHKLQLIVAYQIGFAPATLPDPIWTRGFSKNFIAYQQVGAIVAYSLSVLWLGRQHYAYVARRALGQERAKAGEEREALSYPVAFWGFMLASAFLVVWTVAAGVRLDIALVLWLAYLAVAIVLSRVVVEGGLLLVHTGWAPLGPIAHLTGGWIPASSGVPAAFIGGALMTELRGFLLPSFVHSFKLAHDRKIPAKPLLALIFSCILIAMAVSWLTIIKMGYEVGGLQLQEWWARGAGAQGPARNAKEIVSGVQDSFLANWLWTGVGFMATWGMMAMRSRFMWFPLHPIGYVMFAPFAITTFWASIFVGWLLKSMITRFGGADTYRKVTPLFLGLVLGDVASMVFWIVIDGWQGRMGHILMPG